MNRNIIGALSGTIWTWISAAEIEGILKLVSMGLGVLAALFFAVKMYYDMKSSIKKHNNHE